MDTVLTITIYEKDGNKYCDDVLMNMLKKNGSIIMLSSKRRHATQKDKVQAIQNGLINGK